MFIDTHCHIPFDKKEEYVCDAKKNSVNTLVTASEDYASSLMSVQMSNMFDGVFACVGVHPEHASEFKDEDIIKYEELIKDNKVVGIGEIGLDYYYGKENRERQIKVFKLFLDLASKYHLPVVIHSRDAYVDTISILKEYNLKGIIHCFTSSYEVGKEYIKLGYKLGIGGVLTFKNSKLFEAVKRFPKENLVLETDAPFLAPHPFRGKENSSKYIPIIAECLAFHLGISKEEVANFTSHNAKEVFDRMSI